MKHFDSHRPAEVLLVEDNEGDILITQTVFAESKIANRLHVVEDGTDAMQYLRKEAPYTDAVTPDLVLLDINLPKMDGKDVLKAIKDDPVLRLIPVIMLTSSQAERDIVKSYGLHANGYMIKPVSIDKFTEIIEVVEQFWFSIMVLPDATDVRHLDQS